uniref:Tudor domain-containing protein n=1 Tax=Setaria digitata TaxID=48799 RepID=A0A915PZQ8_9BILA
MAILSLPSTVSDFEGEISHAVVAGNETLIFIKPSTWQGEWNKINAKLQSLASSLEKITSLSGVKSGEIYIVKVKSSFERSYIIRRPTPDTYSIYLIDKGMQCETQFGEIYEFPVELLEFGLFSCVCPVLVPYAEELSIYKSFAGYKCKCIVEGVSKSFVVVGFIRGRLLVKSGGHYEDLQDIIFGKAVNLPGSSGIASAKLNITTGKHGGYFQVGQVNDSSSSSSESVFRRPFYQKAGQKAIANAGFSFQNKRATRTGIEFVAECDKMKMGSLFNQTAFKQYVPEMLPVTVAARFDKRDRVLNTFWVVNKKVFAAVERALKEINDKLSHFPLLIRRGEDIQMRQTPCIARARADNPYKSLYRAVPAQYDSRTNRFSIFLVDFGWFKWVLATDVIDISAMSKSHPIRNLPVAMIHCREDPLSTLHAKDLNKGTNCEVIIKGHSARDIYTVDLVELPVMSKSQVDGRVIEPGLNGQESASNALENEMISSCKKLVAETCQRQLMTSMMMETLSIASRELAQQPRNFWPGFCPSTFALPMPMMMPLPIPVMLPVPIPSGNHQGSGDNTAVRPTKTAPNNFENGSFSNHNSGVRRNVRPTNINRSPRPDFQQKSGARLQNNNSQPATEWARNDFNAGSGFDAPNDNNKQAPRNSTEHDTTDSLWDVPQKYTKERRTFPKVNLMEFNGDTGSDGNAQKGRLASWEKTAATDRVVRKDQDDNQSGNK